MDERQAVRVFQHRLEQAGTGGVDSFLKCTMCLFYTTYILSNGKKRLTRRTRDEDPMLATVFYESP